PAGAAFVVIDSSDALVSEVYFQRELADARVLGSGNGAEAAGVQARRRVVEVCPVAHVEELGPELHAVTFCDREVLEYSHVPVEQTRAAQAVFPEVTERACRGEFEGRREQ